MAPTPAKARPNHGLKNSVEVKLVISDQFRQHYSFAAAVRKSGTLDTQRTWLGPIQQKDRPQGQLPGDSDQVGGHKISKENEVTGMED